MEASCSLSKSTSTSTTTCSDDDGLSELRRGPWTAEEDSLLVHYISCHGEGRWNLLAKRSGLKRTGKSCRLRWLNYLKPDVKRGNLSPEEQLLILELHSKWGNRWSKIAQYLPGRTDNEIKNYWRTRVQKQARHLKIDANSTEFQELIRTVWMPRLLQKVQGTNPFPDDDSSPAATTAPLGLQNHQMLNAAMENNNMSGSPPPPRMSYSENPIYPSANNFYSQFQNEYYNIDTDSILDMESFNSSAAAPGTRVGGSTGPTNYSSDQTNWLQISDDMGHCFWNNLDEFWQVKQPKERYT